MHDDHLDRLILARFFYRAAKYRGKKFPDHLSFDVADSEPSAEQWAMVNEQLKQFAKESGEITILNDLIAGTSVSETANQLGLSTSRVYQIRENIFQRIETCVN
jgi:DNA-binding NarL/FixJ family response regulator